MENLLPSGFEVRHQGPGKCVVGLGYASSHEDLQSLLPAFLIRLLQLRIGIASVFRYWGFIRPKLRLRHTEMSPWKETPLSISRDDRWGINEDHSKSRTLKHIGSFR